MLRPADYLASLIRNLKDVAQLANDLVCLVSRFLALIVLLLYLPGLVAVSLAIILTSAGPAFVSKAYRRQCGNVVYLYEFRTECWTTYRETPIGVFLRVMDLVRLPRLANVLLGEIGAGERVERIAA